LYFRILKNPTSTPLLPSALSGISKFTHLINIDFFSDLMKILKDIISREGLASSTHLEHISAENASENTSRKLICIVTAFELLSGQGASLLH
jgi:nucleolar complex protein 3